MALTIDQYREYQKSQQIVGKLRGLLHKMHTLRNETLQLAHPLPHARELFVTMKKVMIADGSNQSGKTSNAALMVARALCGHDPKRFPRSNGCAVFVGLDGDHLADPMFKKLFKPGEFKLIPDEQTGLLRAVRPDPSNPLKLDPYDDAYREKWVDAPPMIPERMVVSHAWEQQNKEIPRVTKLVNGWRILWRSSNGKPPQGIQVHLIWADEELNNSYRWINEMIPRLIRHGGRLLWSATPENGGPELYELREKADADSQYVHRTTFLIDQNPFFSDEEKAAFKALLTDEMAVAVKYYGEYALTGRRVYPTYDPMGIHGCEPFEIPDDWCRYVVLDPGTTHCGTCFAAVDPEESHVWIYDSMDLTNSDASRWAGEVLKRQGEFRFEAFIIDQQMGKETHVGGAMNVAQQYFNKLTEAGVVPRSLGPLHGFFAGSNDIQARQESLREWMNVRGSGPWAGTAKLQVFRGCNPVLDRQIKLAQTDPKNPKKRLKGKEDVLVTAEYLSAHDPRWNEPESLVSAPPRDTVFDRFQQKKKMLRRKTARVA